MKPKRPLRSSKNVYSRLKWDSSFPSENVYIGYTDRHEGIREIPFADFRPGGRIPWDRIQYFRRENVRIWDRQARIDLVFGSGESASQDKLVSGKQGAAYGPGFSAHPLWRYDPVGGEWMKTGNGEDRAREHLRIISWNVLRSDYDKELLRNELRIPSIIRSIIAADADFIFLQEVQEELLESLLHDPWIRSEYFVSDMRLAGHMQPHGLLFLSRMRPLELLRYPSADRRSALLARFQFNGSMLNCVALHLPSDRARGGPTARREALKGLVAALPRDEAVLILGDFNMGEEEVSLPGSYRDLWSALRPGHPGFTFDIERNPLARHNSLRGESRRLDHMFIDGEDMGYQADSIQMFAMEAIPGSDPPLFCSDHYGLLLELSCTKAPLLGKVVRSTEMDQTEGDPNKLINTTPHHIALRGTSLTSEEGKLGEAQPLTHKSALCIIPPAELWPEIQALRRQFDPAFQRWMPHINLLYGFIPDAYFESAADLIRESIRDFQPFTIHLQESGVFKHRSTDTLWLGPDQVSKQLIIDLQARLKAIFPQCTEQDRHGSFTPHLTVAKFSRKQSGQLAHWQTLAIRNWNRIAFEAGTVCLISRLANEPFEVRNIVPLGDFEPPEAPAPGLEATLGQLGFLPGCLHEARIRNAEESLRGLIHSFHSPAILTAVGSVGLDIHLAGGDLDLLAAGTIAESKFFSQLWPLLDAEADWKPIRRVAHPHSTHLVLDFGRLPVDLMYVQVEQTSRVTWPELKPVQSSKKGIDNAWVLQSWGDMELIRQAGHSHQESFQLAARALKAWTVQQEINGQAFGLLGGAALSILLSQVPLSEQPGEILLHFFENQVERDWTQPVSTPDSPINTTRNIIPLTAEILQLHFLDGLDCLWEIRDGKRDWAAFFKSPRPIYPATVEIVLRAGTPERLEDLKGWFLQNYVHFLQDLGSQTEIGLRPVPAFKWGGASEGSFRIGLESAPAGAEHYEIGSVLDDWELKFARWDGRVSGDRFLGKLL